eukprot:Anaeramoba_flamelloidesa1371_123.p2 GENE.a1371_123~~a1371_123.p2  ORF type:complete len:141 (+),score=54.43 a1371_123:60-482(+)
MESYWSLNTLLAEEQQFGTIFQQDPKYLGFLITDQKKNASDSEEEEEEDYLFLQEILNQGENNIDNNLIKKIFDLLFVAINNLGRLKTIDDTYCFQKGIINNQNKNTQGNDKKNKSKKNKNKAKNRQSRLFEQKKKIKKN